MTEIWKPVPEFEGLYEVSSLGRVRSLARQVKQMSRHGSEYTMMRKGKLLKPGRASNGYLTVTLGRGNTRLVQHLVALAFLGPRPEGHLVCHNNGDRRDNRAENLRYDTHSANLVDRHDHAQRRGQLAENYGRVAKLTLCEVCAIRTDDRLQAEIAEDYGVSQSTISMIKSGNRWDRV